MFEKSIPKDEAAFAKQVLSQLAAKDYADIEKQLDPDVQAPPVRAALEQMAAFFPSEQPKSVGVVGVTVVTTPCTP